MVTGNGYRNPALQAKMASTVDVLAGGRFTFGIGAGWYEPDYTAYGFDFPDGPQRLRMLAEAVQIIRSLWTQDETSFDGEFYQLRQATNAPKGIQRPHIPMLIGGAGEQVTLKLVAQYGDLCNVIAGPAELERKYAVLRRHCEAVGRDYDSIRRTTITMCKITDSDQEGRDAVPPGSSLFYPGVAADYVLVGTPETIRRRIAAYEQAGVQELCIGFVDVTDPKAISRYAAEFLDG
jgi:alkanesulfonate monooxygenase SsuD/methylene tetrahydromethanopterin reductase-like flavin-dependent oxidoreductase (luciferase family)